MISRVVAGSALAERLCAQAEVRASDPRSRTLVLGPEHGVADAGVALDGMSSGAADRVLMLDWNGTHPDARAESLRAAWEVEEICRRSGAPVLVLRLAPLVGPDSPLWRRLARGARTGRLGTKLVMPVLESDAVRVIERALAETSGSWSGWFEIAGREVMTLDELASLARSGRGRGDAQAGAWEPPLEVLAEQRLVEPALWRERFGLEPTPIREAAARWAA